MRILQKAVTDAGVETSFTKIDAEETDKTIINITNAVFKPIFNQHQLTGLTP